jgi:uncharacterized phage-like protein YoqJ
MIVAATGHRPYKLGGYRKEMFARLEHLARSELVRMRPSAVISGMALGWDMAVARTALDLDIPLIAAVPFPGQERLWPERTREFYRGLLRRARTVEYVSPIYGPAAMQKRNVWMVDRAHEMLTLYDGLGDGGTFNCVKYARLREKPLNNCWGQYMEMRDGG